MNERRSAVLRAVVESFVATAQPVGSNTVLEESGLGVSAATVRNDLQALEEEGFLAKPHTSAGRIPTESGYRRFVDHLNPAQLDSTQMHRVKDFFAQVEGQIEGQLAETSRLLSDLTTYAALVVAPSHKNEIVRSVSLADLGGGRLAFVLLTSSGAVERYLLPQAASNDPLPTDAPVVDEASRCLAEALVGTARGDIFDVPPSGSLAVDTLTATAMEALLKQGSEQSELYVGGTADIAEQFDAASTVKSVLGVLEEHLLMVGLLRRIVESGLSVAIGSETGMLPLSECAVVVSPYEVDGEPVGNIGVIGPTRMDYSRALATVNVVSERLGDSLAASRN